MSERLTKGMAVGFQFLAGFPPFLPSLRVLAASIADLLPPRGSVDDLQTDNGPGHRDPFMAVIGDGPRGFVKAALRLADFLRDVADVDDAVGIELRPVVERHDDVRTSAGLDSRSNPRLDRQPIDRLEVELDPQILLALLIDFRLEQLIGRRHVVRRLEPVKRGALGEGRRPPRGQDPSDPAGASGSHASAAKLQQPTPINAFHVSPLMDVVNRHQNSGCDNDHAADPGQ